MAVLVARTLPLDDLGRYSTLFALLLLYAAVHSSWVGDALTVLPRTEVRVRDGLEATHWGHAAVAACTAPVAALLVVQATAEQAALFGVLVVAWQAEERGRRTLMARLEFWRLAGSDGAYLVVAGVVSAVLIWLDRWSLVGALWAMIAGAVTALLWAQAALPAPERIRPPRAIGDVHLVAAFGAWRGLQSAVGAAAQVLVRLVIAAATSLTVVGAFELARLLTAPAIVLLGAAANVLLPLHAATGASAEKRRAAARRISRITGASASMAAMLLVLLGPDLALLLAPEAEVEVGRVPLMGFALLVLSIAASNDLTARALVVVGSRRVFAYRAAGSATTVVLAASSTWWLGWESVPFALAAGSLVALACTARAMRRA